MSPPAVVAVQSPRLLEQVAHTHHFRHELKEAELVRAGRVVPLEAAETAEHKALLEAYRDVARHGY
jgi:hypothetical protein